MKKIAVKELAYFIHQSGSLTLEFTSNHDQTAGQRAHDYLQDRYNDESLSEVYIKQPISYMGNDYLLHGFIDGVLNENNEIIIEEIKSTVVDLDEIEAEYHKEHMAQLKIYGYLFALQHDMDIIHLRLTYISIIDYQTKSIDNIVKISDLEEFVLDTLEQYLKWQAMIDENQALKEKTLKEITFPFKEKRAGQRELMGAVYKTLINNDILYATAPTGIGKTMATIFPSLKAIKDNDKLFYLTAKGSGKNSPIEALKILMEHEGLKMKAIDITAKRKICNRHTKNCSPEDCPFAIGYFDRLRSATEEIFKSYDLFTSDIITEVCDKHNVCAFEFSLNLSYYCDMVIADYNYGFDPVAHLIRYFEDDTYNPKVLVDEAHNLISRSKEMYSAILNSHDLRVLRAKLNGFKPSVRKDINNAIEQMEGYLELLADKVLICETKADTDLAVILRNIQTKCDSILEENKKIKDKDEILDIYFKIRDFIRVSEIFSESHRMLVRKRDEAVEMYLYCLDASKFILDTIKSSMHGIVFFSATLYPIEYHANLLTKGEGTHLELKSPFDPNNLDIIINNTVSTKYKDREASVDSIIESIEVVTKSKPGNYMVFFPSYQYMKMVLDKIEDPDYEIIEQKSDLTDIERNEIIDRYKNSNNTKVGFFVMGGAFSEGIDLIGEALSGVIIVSVGLPMYCDENNILKDYFENENGKGFDYAYTYPGITKVIQAVGRVIRDKDDKGIALLIDERFNQARYHMLYPPHWTNKKIISSSFGLKNELNKFYKK